MVSPLGKTAPRTISIVTNHFGHGTLLLFTTFKQGVFLLPELVKSIPGGYDTHYDDPNDYDRYLTKSAIRRLGA